MKKLLALVLALVMTLSLCVVSSNAAFADAADIEHDEAVEAMSTLGVINGKGDNKFDPKGNVTRAEMAKMITIIMLGDIDAAAFKGTTTDLKDVNGHWAEGFIKYCYSQGVIAGKGNGLFDPNANVTAAEAAKMLLVAIGFDAAIQEYTGADWMLNVTRDAQLKGFYDELKNLTSGETLSRDKAAQMIWNAVQADGVKVTKGWNSVDNKITYNYADTDSLLKSTFKASTDEFDYVTVATKVTDGTHKGEFQLAGTYYVDETYADLFGQNVTVMFYDKDKDGNYEVGDGDKVFGVYPTYENAATETMLASAAFKAADYKIKVGNTTYKLDKTAADLMVTADGKLSTATFADAFNGTAIDSRIDADSTDVFYLTDKDGDGDYDYIVALEKNHGEVTYVDSAKVIAGAKTYKFADATIADTLAKKDYAEVSYDLATCKVVLNEIEKASAKVTAKKTNYVKFDADWVYDSANLSIGDTYDYYVLNGVIVKSTKTTSADLSNLVFVSAVDANTVNKNARVYFVDGTSKVVSVDMTTKDYTVPAKGGFYTVSVNDNGYFFKDLDAYTNATNPDAIFNGYTYFAAAEDAVAPENAANNNAGTVDGTKTVNKFLTEGTVAGDNAEYTEIADDAVIFVLGKLKTSGNMSDTAKVITGAQLKKNALKNGATDAQMEADTYGFMTTKVNGLTKVKVAAVMFVSSSTTDQFTSLNASATAKNYGVVVDDPIAISNAIQYTIWNGTENVTVTDKTSGRTIGDVTMFSTVAYSSIDADNVIKDAAISKFANGSASTTANQIGAGAVTAFEKASTGYYDIYVDGNKFTTDKDTVYLTLTTGATETEEIGVAEAPEVVLADSVYGQKYSNVIVTTSGTLGLARVIVFDSTNRLAGAASDKVTITLTATTNYTITDEAGNTVKNTSNVQVGDLLTIKATADNAQPKITGADDISTWTGTATTTNVDISDGSFDKDMSFVVVVTGNLTFNVH